MEIKHSIHVKQCDVLCSDRLTRTVADVCCLYVFNACYNVIAGKLAMRLFPFKL